MPKELLAATTAAAATAEFSANEVDAFPLSMSCSGLGTGETVTLQYHDGTTWVDYYKDGDTSPVQLTPNNSMASVWSFGRFRGNKSATASAVAVMLHTNRTP